MRHLPTSGQPVALLFVATDEVFKARNSGRQERVDWHNIVVFGKAAGELQGILKKVARCMSRDGSERASLKRKTMVASVSAPRSSQIGFNFLVRRRQMRRVPK